MQEQLISLETAKLAKEKGFLWDCENEYNFNGTLRFDRNPPMYISKYFCNDSLSYFSAPTQSFLQKWLREVHDIHIKVLVYEDEGIKSFECTIYSKLVEEEVYDEKTYPTYEEALEQALIESLKVIK